MKTSFVLWFICMLEIQICASRMHPTCTVTSLFTTTHKNLETQSTNDRISSSQSQNRHTKYITKLMLNLINLLNLESTETSTRSKRDLHPSANEVTNDLIIKAGMSDDVIAMPCIYQRIDVLKKKQKLVFSMHEISDTFTVIGAELQLYQKKMPTSASYLLKVIRNPQSPQEKGKKVFEKKISADFTGWISIDVSPIFRGWLKNKSDTQTLYLMAQKDGENLHPATLGIDFQNQDNEPFLVAFLQSDEPANFRIPRHLLASKRKNLDANNNETSENQCKLQPMVVSFKDLGWHNWVLAPEKFTTGYCEGSCKFPLKSPTQATNHAIIQSMMALKYPNQFPKPLCAPHETSSLSVLFNVDTNTILKTYSKMIVKSCKCQ